MRTLLIIAVVTLPTSRLHAQPALTEPPEFPSSIPRPGATHPGDGCFLLAVGTIIPGDVDWVQVSIPAASTQTIVDVDFPEGTSSSALPASVSGGSTGFNIDDGNNALDDFCGLGSSSDPPGSPLDSVVGLGATPESRVVNIGITGGEDAGFTGQHNRNFDYEVWVYVAREPCTSDADCDDGEFCNGAEICMGGACEAGTDPCPGQLCDESNNACVDCLTDGDCDDELFCNGIEICTNGACEAGTDPCPGQLCDESNNACVDCLTDGDCDDELFCNGMEICTNGACEAGVDPCPGQVCDEVNDECTSVGAVVPLDIKPGSCPNALNPNSHGVLPAALVGTSDFDVSAIDVASLWLGRADGVGGSVAPHEGPPGPHSVFEDAATSFDGEPCDCHDLEGDGIVDLVMHFKTDDVVAELELDSLLRGQLVELVIGGNLFDGTEFTASDCVKIQQRGRRATLLYAPAGDHGTELASAAEGADSAAVWDADAERDVAGLRNASGTGCGALGPAMLLMTVASVLLISARRQSGRP